MGSCQLAASCWAGGSSVPIPLQNIPNMMPSSHQGCCKGTLWISWHQHVTRGSDCAQKGPFHPCQLDEETRQPYLCWCQFWYTSEVTPPCCQQCSLDLLPVPSKFPNPSSVARRGPVLATILYAFQPGHCHCFLPFTEFPVVEAMQENVASKVHSTA